MILWKSVLTRHADVSSNFSDSKCDMKSKVALLEGRNYNILTHCKEERVCVSFSFVIPP